eukprot:203114_1
MHSSHYITQLTSMSTPHYAPKGIVSHKSILDGSNTTNDTANDHVPNEHDSDDDIALDGIHITPNDTNDDHINEDEDAKLEEYITPGQSSDNIMGSIDTYSIDTPNDKHHHIPSIKRHIKRMQSTNNKAIATQAIDRLEDTITRKEISVQNELITIDKTTPLDIPEIQTLLFNIPDYLRPFLCRSRIHQLASNSNLNKWGIRNNRKCDICPCKTQSTLHILNGCLTSLNSGRYTWRHDSVLNHLCRACLPTYPIADTPHNPQYQKLSSITHHSPY